MRCQYRFSIFSRLPSRQGARVLGPRRTVCALVGNVKVGPTACEEAGLRWLLLHMLKIVRLVPPQREYDPERAAVSDFGTSFD